MKIDLNKFAKIIAAMNDLENSVENQEYHELLGILSGNRTCLENITLEQLAYYIENLESIVLSGKLNDALSGRLIYADFGFPQG